MIQGEFMMTKEQLAREVIKLSLQLGTSVKAEEILKVCLDESYIEKANT